MELPMAVAIAVLFAAGTYMILRPNLIRLVMGFGLYSNAVNLLLITIGGYTKTSGAPFVTRDPKSALGLMDPLPPDIILTAIVISFAVGALMLIICYRVYADHGTDNPQLLPVDDDFVQGREGAIAMTHAESKTVASPRDHPPAHGPTPAARPADQHGADRRDRR
jgi:multicomponent Na+:H+ antiporter subunit C